MRLARTIELTLLALYVVTGFLGLKLLSGSSYEWMIGDTAMRDAPKRLCELPPDDSLDGVGAVFAVLAMAAGLGLGAVFAQRSRSRLFFIATAAVASFAIYRLYLRQTWCL